MLRKIILDLEEVYFKGFCGVKDYLEEKLEMDAIERDLGF